MAPPPGSAARAGLSSWFSMSPGHQEPAWHRVAAQETCGMARCSVSGHEGKREGMCLWGGAGQGRDAGALVAVVLAPGFPQARLAPYFLSHPLTPAPSLPSRLSLAIHPGTQAGSLNVVLDLYALVNRLPRSCPLALPPNSPGRWSGLWCPSSCPHFLPTRGSSPGTGHLLSPTCVPGIGQ